LKGGIYEEADLNNTAGFIENIEYIVNKTNPNDFLTDYLTQEYIKKNYGIIVNGIVCDIKAMYLWLFVHQANICTENRVDYIHGVVSTAEQNNVLNKFNSLYPKERRFTVVPGVKCEDHYSSINRRNPFVPICLRNNKYYDLFELHHYIKNYQTSTSNGQNLPPYPLGEHVTVEGGIEFIKPTAYNGENNIYVLPESSIFSYYITNADLEKITSSIRDYYVHLSSNYFV